MYVINKMVMQGAVGGMFEEAQDLSQQFLLSNACSVILSYKNECSETKHTETGLCQG